MFINNFDDFLSKLLVFKQNRAHKGPYGPQPGPGPNPDRAQTWATEKVAKLSLSQEFLKAHMGP